MMIMIVSHNLSQFALMFANRMIIIKIMTMMMRSRKIMPMILRGWFTMCRSLDDFAKLVLALNCLK